MIPVLFGSVVLSIFAMAQDIDSEGFNQPSRWVYDFLKHLR
jgi:putative effector of murein hydrolase